MEDPSEGRLRLLEEILVANLEDAPRIALGGSNGGAELVCPDVGIVPDAESMIWIARLNLTTSGSSTRLRRVPATTSSFRMISERLARIADDDQD